MYTSPVIDLTDVPREGRTCGWLLNGEFFSDFGENPLLEAEVRAAVSLRREGRGYDLDLSLEGFVSVPCDRCLAPVRIDVDRTLPLRLKVGPDAEEEDGRELLEMAADDKSYDLSQVIYDYVCLSVPAFVRHPEGECDESVSGHLAQGTMPREDEVREDNPFAGLKDLLKKT